MLFRITNNGKSPRGIHDERGSIVTIQPGETREVRLGEGAAQRYRAKIAGGDKLERVEPLGSGGLKPTPKVVPAPAPAKDPAPANPPSGGKKRGRKSKAEKAAEAAAAAQNDAADAKQPDGETDALAALRSEAVTLGIPEADAAKWGPKRLNREIAARKQGQ